MVSKERLKHSILILFIVLLLILAANIISSTDTPTLNFEKLPKNHMIIEGYFVSIRVGSIRLAETPIGFRERIAGHGAHSMIVSKNKDFEEYIDFSSFRINQKVRIYCDYIRESNPPKTDAFYIEAIMPEDKLE